MSIRRAPKEQLSGKESSSFSLGQVKTVEDRGNTGKGRSLLKRVAVNGLLVAVPLCLLLALSETLLWKYEESLLQKVHVEADDSSNDRWCVPDMTVINTGAFQWDRNGDSLVHTRSKDRTLVYEMRPNAAVGDIIKINALGFRDREFIAKKPEGVYRIAVVGDSVTFGWDQRVEDTYPKVLERLLNSSDGASRRYEVLNLGVVGYNAEQEMELIKTRVLDFQPDLVLVGYCVNDPAIGADMGLWRHFTRSPSRTWDFVKLRCAMVIERYRHEGIVERSYREIARVCSERHVPVLVALFPALWIAYPEGSYYQKNTAMEGLCGRLGLTALDLFPAFAAVDADSTNIANKVLVGVHPTAVGHRVAAEEICRFLKEHEPVSGAGHP